MAGDLLVAGVTFFAVVVAFVIALQDRRHASRLAQEDQELARMTELAEVLRTKPFSGDTAKQSALAARATVLFHTLGGSRRFGDDSGTAYIVDKGLDRLPRGRDDERLTQAQEETLAEANRLADLYSRRRNPPPPWWRRIAAGNGVRRGRQ